MALGQRPVPGIGAPVPAPAGHARDQPGPQACTVVRPPGRPYAASSLTPLIATDALFAASCSVFFERWA